MTPFDFIIREIQPEDNDALSSIIRAVLTEYKIPQKGTAYEDHATDHMYETYQNDRTAYYVVEQDGLVFGGAGISPLEGNDKNICELQKMYFLPAIRGKGIGKKLLKFCLTEAKKLGFDKCYLETMPNMQTARYLYKEFGFKKLEKPMGNTGHYSCNVWMVKNL